MGLWAPSGWMSFALTCGACLALYPFFINYLKKQRWRREVREDVPDTHQTKTGTPSMGGALFVLVTFFVLIPRGAMASAEVALLCLTLLTFGAVGFWDDYMKAVGRREGVKARHKLAGQALFAAPLVWWAMRAFNLEARWLIPFTDAALDLGWLYVPLGTLLLIGASNAANLTDGLDGLLAGLTLVPLAALGVVAGTLKQPDVAMFCGGFGGAIAAFLYFNRKPAKIWMGDAGSLAIGGTVAMTAMLLRVELLLPLLCFIWVAEAGSVMIQVAYFKVTKRLCGEGRRVFLRTPIHHAFELRGWSEWKVVGTFWAAGALAAAAGVGTWLMVNG